MKAIALVSEYLDSSAFPCNRDELICSAEDACAPDALLDALEELPDVRFLDLESVLRRVGIVSIA